jgi:hypothetical protein
MTRAISDSPNHELPERSLEHTGTSFRTFEQVSSAFPCGLAFMRFRLRVLSCRAFDRIRDRCNVRHRRRRAMGDSDVTLCSSSWTGPFTLVEKYHHSNGMSAKLEMREMSKAQPGEPRRLVTKLSMARSRIIRLARRPN